MVVRDLLGGFDADVRVECPVRIEDMSGRVLFHSGRDDNGEWNDNVRSPRDLDDEDRAEEILDMEIDLIGAYDGDDDYSGGVLLIRVSD